MNCIYCNNSCYKDDRRDWACDACQVSYPFTNTGHVAFHQVIDNVLYELFVAETFTRIHAYKSGLDVIAHLDYKLDVTPLTAKSIIERLLKLQAFI